jgi:hypothetical protein
MDIYIKHLKDLAGKGANVIENPKSIAKRDKKFFLTMIDTLSKFDDRTQFLIDLGIDMIKYEDPYFTLIENLILKVYGPLKGGIILWWVGERKLLDVTQYNMIDENGNSTMISNVNQLYNYLNKLK